MNGITQNQATPGQTKQINRLASDAIEKVVAELGLLSVRPRQTGDVRDLTLHQRRAVSDAVPKTTACGQDRCGAALPGAR